MGWPWSPGLRSWARPAWESLDKATLTIHLKWLGIFFRPVTPGRFMVRLRLPNGLIQASQLEVLAEAVDRCGAPNSFLLHNDLAFLPALHGGSWASR